MDKDRLYLGVKGSVVALNKDTGEKLWRTHLKGSNLVTIVIESDVIYAYTYGNLYCIDKAEGGVKWHNGLSGLGYGMAMIGTEGADSASAPMSQMLQAQQAQQMQSAAIASSAAIAANANNQ